MAIEMITRLYTVMLLVHAMLFTLLFFRCVWAIYNNHLDRKVRIVIWGTAALALTASVESWVRAWGRVEQWMCGILPTQQNPEVALFFLAVANVGLLVWMVTLEITTHLGIIPNGQYNRRVDDPPVKEVS